MNGVVYEVTTVAAVGTGIAALTAGGLALARTGRPALALSVLLDLLLAAGLLRLASGPDWQSIATAAAIVALRRIIGAGLRAGGRAWSPRGPRDVAGPAAGTWRSSAAHRLVRPAWRL